MPNGGPKKEYDAEWCGERHVELNKRMDKLENKFWWIIGLLLVNLGGVIATLIAAG